MSVDYRELVRSTAVAAGGDPALALAVGVEESNLDPKAVGDQGHSVGIFQENDQGAGAGLTLEQRQDPVGATQRFVARVKDLLSSGFSGSPGDIAAAVQRPAYPGHYADAVNALYSQEVQTLGTSSTSSSVGGQAKCPPDAFAKAFPFLQAGMRYAEAAARAGVPVECITAATGKETPSAADNAGAAIQHAKDDALNAIGQKTSEIIGQVTGVGTGILVAGVIVVIGVIGLTAVVKGD